MQPGTGCNLDCRYCYLPDRHSVRRMALPVAEAVAETVNAWAARTPGFEVFWHGGEPLSVGRRHLVALMKPFVGVSHAVQTNATLINDAWCEVFAQNQVRVGVSIDGPAPMSRDRRTRSGEFAFTRIMRGIDCLRGNSVPFTALAVLSDPDAGQAAALYRFFADLGATALGISVEQRVGINTRARRTDTRRIAEFWVALAEAWRADPVLRIREIDQSLRSVRQALDRTATPPLADIDPLPTVTSEGDVVLISPELAGFHDARYGDFTSGNVRAAPLHTIVAEAPARTGWLPDHLRAVASCAECRYARFCRGPSPASSYFERGRIGFGMTEHCRATTVALADALCRPVLALAEAAPPVPAG